MKEKSHHLRNVVQRQDESSSIRRESTEALNQVSLNQDLQNTFMSKQLADEVPSSSQRQERVKEMIQEEIKRLQEIYQKISTSTIDEQQDYKRYMESKELNDLKPIKPYSQYISKPLDPSHFPSNMSSRQDPLKMASNSPSENLGTLEAFSTIHREEPLKSMIFNKAHYQRQFSKLISNNRIEDPKIATASPPPARNDCFKTSIGHKESPKREQQKKHNQSFNGSSNTPNH